ncbi:hypothetical protein K493DRAFT_310543 [Basidiobolus meristosporus CBS 931.73]|uniref:Uncharacterized protein n=1 Tax=Basidiobolus meristosporus CBS 931.73 TaxID=1314790 RepID=A0A1Y1Z8L2_9FUNG|nr:hypothetical protein K493DRAFT_310543 [Basidiobolus meristosporus CBS 931.73]|eukprot:ORY06609.1 hypothetical protein K493DRAFT_310543 [Basidiobolus meristosporus CBS 931.73]
MRTLSYAQRQRITSYLFFSVAVGSVFTVAAPTVLPCPASDRMHMYAEEEQMVEVSKSSTLTVIQDQKDSTPASQL